MTDAISLSIRMARRADATCIANIFVDSWRDTYAGILPDSALIGLSTARETQSWSRTIARQSMRNPVLVAADASERIYGFTSAGSSRDASLPYQGEVYTLYVAPGHTGQGIGRALLNWTFRLFKRSGFSGAIIWALADNPSRFFYESQGGSIVAERTIQVFGSAQREIAYGWPSLTPVAGDPS
jgi:L-amino acid N-acyltransferase YncA